MSKCARSSGVFLLLVVLIGFPLVISLEAVGGPRAAPERERVFRDYWVTPPDGPEGGTYQDVTIPFGFFGPECDAFEGRVHFVGSPLDPDTTGNADTVLERSADPVSARDAEGTTGTVTLRLTELSLVSEDPIAVECDDGLSLWHVHVGLSSEAPWAGWMTATKTHEDGGTFDSMIYVQPLLTFTNVDDPDDVLVFDMADVSDPAELMAAEVPFVLRVEASIARDDPDSVSGENVGTEFIPGIEAPTDSQRRMDDPDYRGPWPRQVRPRTPLAVHQAPGHQHCVEPECYTDTECDDENDCTIDRCIDGRCYHDPQPAGTPCGSHANTECDDPDTCSSGTCQPNYEPSGTPCSDDGNQCTNDMCNGSGSCTHPNKPNGTSCGSGSNTDCDDPDTCSSGTCQPNHEPDGTACTYDGDPCTVDECRGGTCVHAPIPDCPGGGGGEGQKAPNGGSDPDNITTEVSDPVCLFSGEYYLEREDLRIPGRGFDFVWARKYRSREDRESAQGINWDFSYNRRVEAEGDDRVVCDGNSRRDAYEPAGVDCWTAEGFFSTLCLQPDDRYVLTFPDMLTWTFAPLDGAPHEGKIIEIRDRNGNAITFDYDGAGRLVTIHDTLDTAAHERDISIAYNAGGYIESVTDWAGRSVAYAYYNGVEPGGSAGDLKSVTYPVVEYTVDFPIPAGHEYPDGKTWTYTYTKDTGQAKLDHNLLSITDARGQTYLNIIYSATTDPSDPAFDRVLALNYGTGIFNYVYLAQTPTSENNFATTKTIVNDRAGNVEELFYNDQNQHVMRREYTGRADPTLPTTDSFNRPTNKLRLTDPDFFDTRYEYNINSLVTRKEFPNGNVLEQTYDSSNPDVRARGNLLEERHLPGPLGGDQTEILQTYTYHPVYNFVATHINGRGFTTTYTYDAANGDLLRIDHPTVTLGVLGGGSQTIVDQYEYNAFGQMTRHINPGGRVDEYTYHTTGHQQGYLRDAIIDAPNLALTTTKTYDTVGNAIAISDPRGNAGQFIYNQLNQVVRRIAKPPFLYETDHFYDENDNLVQVDVQNVDDQGVVHPNTHFTTTYEYDTLDNLIRMIQEVDEGTTITTEYEYDPNENRTLIRYGEATNGSQPTNVVRTFYDERDLVFQRMRAEGDADQSTTEYVYDGDENLTIARAGLEDIPRVTTYEYDGYNRMTSSTDPMGNVTTDHYDAGGNRISARSDGELIDVAGAAGNVRLFEATYAYDEIDRLYDTDLAFFDTQTGLPIGDGIGTAKTFYNVFSQVIRVEDDNAHVTDTAYDTANRRGVVTDHKGNTVTYGYDENSNVTALTELEKSDLGGPDQTFVSTHAYDALDRRTQTVDNVANTNTFGYDSRHNRTVTVDALNHETRFVHDGVNRLVQTVRDLDGDGADGDGTDISTGQTWDDTSRLVGQTDDNTNTTGYAYDALNRLTTTTYADGTAHSDTYDVHDNKITVTDANGSVVTATYDLLNRLTAKAITRAPGVLGTTIESLQYDGLSRLARAEDDDSIVTWAHDSLGNVLQETLIIDKGGPNETTGTITASYDGVGNQLSSDYPGGRVITAQYDELDRKQTITDETGAPAMVAAYDYVGPGRVERREYANGTRTDYVYDGITGVPNPPNDFGVKRIIGTTHSRISNTTILDDRTYTWDRMYNKTQRKDVRAGGPQLTHDYTYDAIYRLIHTTVSDTGPMVVRPGARELTPGGTDESIYRPIDLPGTAAVVRETHYDFDGVGNRTTVGGTPNPGPYTMDPALPEPGDFQTNQYTTTSFDARLYDKNGNLITIDYALPTQRDAAYDYRNQMVEYEDLTTTQRHTYAYDALGRRIARVVDADGAAGGPTETRYFYDGWQVVEEQDQLGASEASYVYGLYIDEVLNMQRGGADYYYHTDDLYNVMAVTDAIGAVVECYEYLDYGQPADTTTGAPIPNPQSAIDNPYRFTGRRFDPETAWYYYRTRYLEPNAGRFTIRDTIGTWGDVGNVGNGYTYAGNNPWTIPDPSGQGKEGNRKKARRELLRIAKYILKQEYGVDIDEWAESVAKWWDELPWPYKAAAIAGGALIAPELSERLDHDLSIPVGPIRLFGGRLDLRLKTERDSSGVYRYGSADVEWEQKLSRALKFRLFGEYHRLSPIPDGSTEGSYSWGFGLELKF